MGDDAAGGTLGTVYRNTVPSFTVARQRHDDRRQRRNPPASSWPAWPRYRQSAASGRHLRPGQAWTGDPHAALYAAHDNHPNFHLQPTTWNSAVCRTLEPRDGMPKPGISGTVSTSSHRSLPAGVKFTLEPSSLKYCGCCTLDTNTTLYAIDDESGNWTAILMASGAHTRPQLFGSDAGTDRPTDGVINTGYTPALRHGMLWAYTDCLAKKGPVLKSPADQFLVGADPVTGRNQQIDLAWEQLCLAPGYELQIAKDKDFTLRINPAINSARHRHQRSHRLRSCSTWIPPT